MVLQSLTRRLAMVGLMVTVATGAFAYTGQDLAANATVKIEDARAIALKARPGAISPQRNSKRKRAAAAFAIPSG